MKTTSIPKFLTKRRVERRPLSWDILGIWMSVLCLAHCLAAPALILLLAFIGFSNHADADAHPIGPFMHHAHGAACGHDPSTDAAGSGHSHSQWVHAGLLFAVAPVGMISLTVGYRHHRRTGIVALGGAGIALLSVALILGGHFQHGAGETVLTVLGSVLLVSAHLINRTHARCRTAHENGYPPSPIPPS